MCRLSKKNIIYIHYHKNGSLYHKLGNYGTHERKVAVLLVKTTNCLSSRAEGNEIFLKCRIHVHKIKCFYYCIH